MKKSVNLNSGEWCDVIFENKNKSYGAYEMRMTSTKRHLIAFGIIILATLLVAFAPILISKASVNGDKASIAIDEDRILSRVEIDKEKEEPIDIFKPEPPKINRQEIVNSIRFTAPNIAEDEMVPDDVETNTVDDVMDDNRAIGYMDVDDGTDDRSADLLMSEAILTDGPTDKESGHILDFVEVMPQFPGGNTELMKFIKDNLQYPVVDQEIGRQGRVIIRFVVTETGNIEQATVQSGVSVSCDREAIRVVKSMPKWIPGKQNGKAVSVYFTLPILYRLM